MLFIQKQTQAKQDDSIDMEWCSPSGSMLAPKLSS